MDEQNTASQSHAKAERLDGVVIGVLVGLDSDGHPLVAFPANPEPTGVSARSTAALTADDMGREVALLFEEGDPARPLVIGPIQHPAETTGVAQKTTTVQAIVDNERLELKADKEIVLRCGKASITLTRAGKVILRGAYLLSRSSGVNRIKGGSVQIN